MQTEDWGLISYQEALTRQLEKVELVAQGADDVLIYCSHPPVVTLGRATKPDDVTTWRGEIIQISRGGRATYHGPSQIVVYPILNLNRTRNNVPARDLHAYLRALENSLVLTLKEFGLSSEVRSVKPSANEPSLTGVWIRESTGVEKKIASIGIAVKKWVTFHGMAINLHSDVNAFAGIRPCGFSTELMTSVETQIRNRSREALIPDRHSVQNTLTKFLLTAISYQL